MLVKKSAGRHKFYISIQTRKDFKFPNERGSKRFMKNVWPILFDSREDAQKVAESLPVFFASNQRLGMKSNIKSFCMCRTKKRITPTFLSLPIAKRVKKFQANYIFASDLTQQAASSKE